jgi:hypothetical protein
MDYLPVEECLQEMFMRNMPLSSAQSGRIARLSTAVLLAGEVHLSKMARFVKSESQQDSRVRWIERLLRAPFMCQELVYQPMLQVALQKFRDPYWHLVIDRTTLWDGHTDLATISLNYRKRAIPVVWSRVPFGGAELGVYVELMQRCVPLIPAHATVVFHGDTEFGGQRMVRALREVEWDFMLAQPRRVHFRQRGADRSMPLKSLPVTKTHPCQLAHVDLFAQDALGAINLLAFYAPHYTQCGTRKRDLTYLATSLPLTPGLRRLGRRRWGTEPFYRDFKSAGWQVTHSCLQHSAAQDGLLIVLALTYLWAVCTGRWLCKTGQRHCVDAKAQRHLSLFRLGWDWLIHCLRCDLPCPLTLNLYS